MQVIFTLLNETKVDDAQASQPAVKVQDHLYWACIKAAQCYRNQQRVFIFCDNQQVAHQIDELLWSFSTDSFVPHNLPGEGLNSGSPVEISWQAPTNQRHILINLASELPSFASQFSQIIDFVPSDEALKKLARIRYRGYQQLGFKVTTSPAQAA